MRAIASVRTAIIAITFAGTLLADYRFVTVNYPGQPATALTAINASGQIAGDAYNTTSTSQVVFFTDTQGNIGLSFQYPGVAYTHSSGIDNAGDVIGQYVIPHVPSGFAFLRSATGAFTPLPLPLPLPPVLTFPSGQAISGSGAIVLSASNDPHLFFRAADGSYTSVLLAVPGIVGVNVRGIDNAGNVVGDYGTVNAAISSFFRNVNGVIQTIQVPGALLTQVAGINNLGQAVGYYFDTGRAAHGFLWRGGSDFTVIDFPGARDTFASGINDSGVIVGSYAGGATFYQHGMIAFPGGVVSPVPAPSSLWLAVTGCLALGGFWFLRRRLWHRYSCLCCFLILSLHGQVTTSQYDNARTGANLNETTLTPQNVNAARFGKLFSLKADGDIYAQPLYLPGVEIPGKGKHNVVFVATEHDSVYAFDADGQPSTPLWHVNFLNVDAGITTVPDRDVRCPFIRPEIGITPTPAIDITTGTLYVLARTKESQGLLAGTRYVQRLHALAITTGAEKFGGPVEIKASVKGRGAGGSSGQIDFDPLRELPRAGLLLVKGKVYLTWASSCDVAPYHGWIIAYDARTLSQTAVFNTSPDAEESGIWQSDTAPAADADGNVFVATGNGKFDVAAVGGRDYGDSVLKLALSAGNLALRDFFTPYNQQELNAQDADLGSGGPVLLPDQPGPHPHLLIVGGKAGALYVIDRDRMGRWQAGSDSHAVQVLPIAEGIYSAAAYWNGHVYIFAAHSVLKDFALEHGQLSAQPVARGTTQFIDPGATPTISANGSRSGIVWVLRSKGWRSPDTPAVLYAYDAANVAHELYNSEQNPIRDRAGFCLRFNIPTVVNGKVYVGAKSQVDVYGLLPAR